MWAICENGMFWVTTTPANAEAARSRGASVRAAVEASDVGGVPSDRIIGRIGRQWYVEYDGYTDSDLRDLAEFALSCHEALVRYGEHVPGMPPQVRKALRHLGE